MKTDIEKQHEKIMNELPEWAQNIINDNFKREVELGREIDSLKTRLAEAEAREKLKKDGYEELFFKAAVLCELYAKTSAEASVISDKFAKEAAVTSLKYGFNGSPATPILPGLLEKARAEAFPDNEAGGIVFCGKCGHAK